MKSFGDMFMAANGRFAQIICTLLLATSSRGAIPQKPADLFQETNIWTVHLKFTPEQWEAMEPQGGGGFFGGGQRGPGGPNVFGPAMFVAPAFVRQGDADADGKLSKQEFQGLAEKWFGAWDKDKKGALNLEQLGGGLNSVLMPPNSPPVGGRAGRPPGMNLQGPEGKRNGLASAMGIEFKYVHADLEFEGQRVQDVAVRYKGNGTFMESRGSLKRSLKVSLSEYNKTAKVAGISKLNLHNNVTDASWMNEVMSFRLHRDAGVPSPRSAYARVFVTVPGKHDRKYFGLYSLVEDVDKSLLDENFHTKKGAVFKPVTPALFADLGDDWAKYKQTYDPKTELSPKESGRVMEFCRLVANADDAEFAARLGDYIDLDEFARFMAVMVFLSDLDGILDPGQNFYLYLHPKTQKFEFIPWDQDHSFGQFGMRGTQEQREHLSIHHPWQGENRFLDRVFKASAFKTRYLAKLDEFSKTIFKPERFAREVDEIAAAIRPAVAEESAEKLARFDRVVAGESIAPSFPGFGGPGRQGGPPFGGPGGFFQSNKPIKPFVKIRAQSVAEQVAGKSEGQTLPEFGFGRGFGGGGPPGGPPGGGPGGGRGRGGPGAFGPGMFLANAFLSALDGNKDNSVSRDEFVRGFAQWFEKWNSDKTGQLTEDQLRAGINEDLSPFRGGPPGGFRFGPPPGAPVREQ